MPKYSDARNKRPIIDITMDPIGPGKTSDERFVEAAAPRGTKITQVILYNDAQQEAMVVDLPYDNPASMTVSPEPDGGSSLCPSLLLPLLLLGAAAAHKMKR